MVIVSESIGAHPPIGKVKVQIYINTPSTLVGGVYVVSVPTGAGIIVPFTNHW